MEGHSECFSKRAEEVEDKFRTSVRGNMGWDSMLGEHMCNKELGELRGSDGVVSWNEYSLLRQAVHDDEDEGDWELFK